MRKKSSLALKKSLYIFLLCNFLFVFGLPKSYADLYTFDGTVTDVNLYLPDGYVASSPVSTGDYFTGFFYYSFDTTPDDMNPSNINFGIYDQNQSGGNLNINYAIYFNDFSVNSGIPTHIFIENQNPSGMDSFVIEDYYPTYSPEIVFPGEVGSAFVIDDSSIILKNSTGDAFVNDSLPSSINVSSFDQFSIRIVGGRGWDDEINLEISGAMNDLSRVAAPVPEPSTMVLFLTGLSVLTVVARRKK